MKSLMTTGCLLLMSALVGAGSAADQYSAVAIDEPAPADALAPEIAAQLLPNGFRVLEGDRTLWEFWLAKQWSVEAGAATTGERLYALQPGTLIGVARLRRRGADFRDQTISRGVYTLRYALQPVDGNHVGTSATRDFLLMVKAEDDTSAEAKEAEGLIEASAAAAGSSHPAMISLKKIDDGAQSPAVRSIEGTDWWAMRLVGAAGEEEKPLPIDVVVVGHAAE
jgi:hypothetical protein